MFSQETLGVLGTASRRFFHGPGINNWDIAIAKDTRLTEGTSLEIPGEFFNAFNHAQFLLNYSPTMPTRRTSDTSGAPTRPVLSSLAPS